MAKRVLNVGLIGYQFMGKAHSNMYRQVGHYFDLDIEVNMHTLCGRTAHAVEAAAEKLGWANVATDWRAVVENPEIDVIDVSTPGDSHCEIACAAAEAGKMVFCEKPIGNTLKQAKDMLEAVRLNGVPNLVFHNYRAAPAVALAKIMIDSGRLGTIYHMRATYLQDWIADPQFPLVWRLQKERAGSGALGDIHSHIIDLGRFLLGEFESVVGKLHTFIEERPLVAATDDKLGAKASEQMGKVTVDDASMCLAKFRCGALGTFEASRFAVGRKNYNRFEINGSKGSVVFNLERMNELEYYNAADPDGEQGFRLIQATEAAHPYAGHYWPPGHIIGYEHTFINLMADALSAISEGKRCSPDFQDGYENQRVLDAIERSSLSGSWVNL
ncbi:MAG: Gfo/Idh/MocA family oxidoreductase [Fimbriimonadaceae bacterium]|uniref:Dehydrogenase n=1 Tax=Candidatus Nitrosymbiomonas proteolyticus TaxID=2608984 RepID=A0A809RI41_9BACT|nr:Gfo/Idh/MocA family oxidoreductase [Fimbriimonadaceae bacterium]NUM39917.1 Gfo/Idh/MocA family oxidoreductase [Armatimonadota bacterium]BBO24165.1 dehydrogenase [Candidatus Nitrosymbiomonas proteolyticus]HQU18902.1 Gfo/Idh/MocA family oxidoreductase [Fimbriimonadaceae bacterium]